MFIQLYIMLCLLPRYSHPWLSHNDSSLLLVYIANFNLLFLITSQSLSGLFFFIDGFTIYIIYYISSHIYFSNFEHVFQDLQAYLVLLAQRLIQCIPVFCYHICTFTIVVSQLHDVFMLICRKNYMQVYSLFSVPCNCPHLTILMLNILIFGQSLGVSFYFISQMKQFYPKI